MSNMSAEYSPRNLSRLMSSPPSVPPSVSPSVPPSALSSGSPYASPTAPSIATVDMASGSGLWADWHNGGAHEQAPLYSLPMQSYPDCAEMRLTNCNEFVAAPTPAYIDVRHDMYETNTVVGVKRPFDDVHDLKDLKDLQDLKDLSQLGQLSQDYTAHVMAPQNKVSRQGASDGTTVDRSSFAVDKIGDCSVLRMVESWMATFPSAPTMIDEQMRGDKGDPTTVAYTAFERAEYLQSKIGHLEMIEEMLAGWCQKEVADCVRKTLRRLRCSLTRIEKQTFAEEDLDLFFPDLPSVRELEAILNEF